MQSWHSLKSYQLVQLHWTMTIVIKQKKNIRRQWFERSFATVFLRTDNMYYVDKFYSHVTLMDKNRFNFTHQLSIRNILMSFYSYEWL